MFFLNFIFISFSKLVLFFFVVSFYLFEVNVFVIEGNFKFIFYVEVYFFCVGGFNEKIVVGLYVNVVISGVVILILIGSRIV